MKYILYVDVMRYHGQNSILFGFFQCLCIWLTRELSHQGIGCGGTHIHHQWILWRTRWCCRDACYILSKRPHRLNQIYKFFQEYPLPWVKVDKWQKKWQWRWWLWVVNIQVEARTGMSGKSHSRPFPGIPASHSRSRKFFHSHSHPLKLGMAFFIPVPKNYQVWFIKVENKNVNGVQKLE